MKRPLVTILLFAITVALAAVRLYQRSHRQPQHGITTVLIHTCAPNEAVQQLGNDRPIVITTAIDGSIEINGYAFSRSTVGPELENIFKYRDLKLVWFVANPQHTYGEAIGNLSALNSQTTNFIVALPRTTQVSVTDSAKPSTIPDQCPYGLEANHFTVANKPLPLQQPDPPFARNLTRMNGSK